MHNPDQNRSRKDCNWTVYIMEDIKKEPHQRKDIMMEMGSQIWFQGFLGFQKIWTSQFCSNTFNSQCLVHIICHSIRHNTNLYPRKEFTYQEVCAHMGSCMLVFQGLVIQHMSQYMQIGWSFTIWDSIWKKGRFIQGMYFILEIFN